MSSTRATTDGAAVATADTTVSVVIPTFNRRPRLEAVLRALERQTYTGPMEVVVVSDGSTDDTVDFLESSEFSLTLTVAQQPNAGPSVARNRGVELARHDLVVFLDDDVVPDPDLVAQHVEAHGRAGRSDHVVIGPMLAPDDTELSPWAAWEQEKLDRQYRALEADAVASYRQFYTGNASLFRDHLVRVGGFEPSLRRSEDVELAYRLDCAGLRFRFCGAARGRHYLEIPFDAWLSKAYVYGRDNVAFARGGQDFLWRTIAEEFRERHWLLQWTVRMLLGRPRAAAAVLCVFRAFVRLASAVGAGRATSYGLSAMYGLEHYRGVADELGSAADFVALVDRAGLDPDVFTVVYVAERTMGHATHASNLERLLGNRRGLQLRVVDVDDDLGPIAARIPGWSNWTVRSGIRARRGLRASARQARAVDPDAMFVHSQVPAILLGRWMRRTPTVVSLDATPVQYDSLGASYGHEVGPAVVERLKLAMNRRCFATARHVVAWSSWARDGLIDDYGVAPDEVTVIPPGVDVALWARPAPSETLVGEPIGVLFVGADLERKGGRRLIEAAELLRRSGDVPDFEVHLVTRTPIDTDGTAGVVVHVDLVPNSRELVALAHRCEIFCLPTSGDCLPLALAEAGAAGLALISTDVGAVGEIVRSGETGELVEVGDVEALAAALGRLLRDAELRRRYGANAAALVRTDHDAERNAVRLVELMASVAGVDLPAGWSAVRDRVGEVRDPTSDRA